MRSDKLTKRLALGRQTQARSLPILMMLGAGLAGPGCGGPGGGPFGGGGEIPSELVGAWYAGQGGTSVPYDASTGSFGMPSGKGLVYVFENDGSYTKAFQSYESSGGCTVGFTAFEQGYASDDEGRLTTSPGEGHLVFENSCSPGSRSDEPLSELLEETFEWSFRPSEINPESTVLFMTRTDGAASEFRKL